MFRCISVPELNTISDEHGPAIPFFVSKPVLTGQTTRGTWVVIHANDAILESRCDFVRNALAHRDQGLCVAQSLEIDASNVCLGE
jgi:hypothetical protein